MDLIEAYHEVNDILDTLDFEALFKGFHKYRFALYNSKEIVLDGMVIPYQDEFRGNTAKKYEEEYIAIWNMEFDPVEDIERLAYLLVHEMFHCHQFMNKTTDYPSDLDLLNYPDDIENFTKKYNENRYLANAYELRCNTMMRRFVCIREKRYKKYPSMVREEWKVETVEGMAEYIGLKALERINPEKYNDIINHYLGILREESNLLFDVRRISYYVGAIFFLCMDRFGFSGNYVLDSEKTAYEQNIIDIEGIIEEVLPYEFISSNYEAMVKEKKEKLEAHMELSNYVECNALICGYDPMNMFRLGDLIFCKYFVCLNENGEVKTFNSAIALKLKDDSNCEVVGYYA